jgi:transposase
MVRASIEADVGLLDVYHDLIVALEAEILSQAKLADPVALILLQSIPGFGKILSLVIIYEVDDIYRFPAVGNFVSYCRLVKPAHESAGKKQGSKHSKIGNVHLKWAFSEAACLFLKGNERAQKYHEKLVSKYGKPKALTILAQKLGRSVYTMLKRRRPFDPETFFGS